MYYNPSSPTDKLLKDWGVTRAQYRSLFNAAEKEYELKYMSGKGWLGRILSSGFDTTNEVNKYLYGKMASSNGQWGRDILNKQTQAPKGRGTSSVTPKPNTTNTRKTARDTVTARSTGAVSTSTPVAEPTPQKVSWQGRNVDGVAAELGFTNYKLEDILKAYNDVTNAKFDELDTQTKRAQAQSLRALEGQYDNYLNQLRSDRANAVSNGITKGTSAAMQIASMFNNASAIKEQQQALNDVLFDLSQQRGTALETNRLSAQKDRQAFQQYLSGLLGTYEANSVNELASRLAHEGQIKAAQIGANATTNAAGIAAQGSVDAANAQNDYLYNMIKKAQAGDRTAGTYTDLYGKYFLGGFNDPNYRGFR